MEPSSIQLTERSTLWSVRLEKLCYLDYQSEWSETEPEGESEEADEHDEEQLLSTDRDNDTHLLL